MDINEYQALVQYLKKEGPIYPDHYTDNQKRALRKSSKSFILKNGVLHHLRDGMYLDDPQMRLDKAQKVVYGDVDKDNILRELHGGVPGGHFGQRATQLKVAERYWWKGFSDDVKAYVKACDVCQKANPVHRPVVAELHPIPVTNEFGYRWCIDLIGPLTTTARGNQYIAVATEYLTRTVVVEALPSKDAVSVGHFVYDRVICMFGAMKILQHDQGREFCNSLLESIRRHLKIKAAISTAYHPQTNGLTERFNQTLETMLMKLTNIETWDLELQTCAFAYRTKIQCSTKKTPYEMLYGCQARLPIQLDDILDDASTVVEADMIHDAFTSRLKEISSTLVTTRAEGLANLKAAQKRQKAAFALKHGGGNQKPYEIGDKVLKLNASRNRRQGGRTEPRYFPSGQGRYYEIREILNKGVYLLRDPFLGKDLFGKVNGKHLKLYVEPLDRPVDTSVEAELVDVSQQVSEPSSIQEEHSYCSPNRHVGSTNPQQRTFPINSQQQQQDPVSNSQPKGKNLLEITMNQFPLLTRDDVFQCIKKARGKIGQIDARLIDGAALRKIAEYCLKEAEIVNREKLIVEAVISKAREERYRTMTRATILRGLDELQKEVPGCIGHVDVVDQVYEKAKCYYEIFVQVDDKKRSYVVFEDDGFEPVFQYLARDLKMPIRDIHLEFDDEIIYPYLSPSGLGYEPSKDVIKFERIIRPQASPETVARNALCRKIVAKNQLLVEDIKSQEVQEHAVKLLQGAVRSDRTVLFEKWWSGSRRNVDKSRSLGPFVAGDDVESITELTLFYIGVSERIGGSNPVTMESSTRGGGGKIVLPPATLGFIDIVVLPECLKLSLTRIFDVTEKMAKEIMDSEDEQLYLNLKERNMDDVEIVDEVEPSPSGHKRKRDPNDDDDDDVNDYEPVPATDAMDFGFTSHPDGDEPVTWFCPECRKLANDGSTCCDDCDVWFHWKCVGMSKAPPSSQKWYCPRCSLKQVLGEPLPQKDARRMLHGMINTESNCFFNAVTQALMACSPFFSFLTNLASKRPSRLPQLLDAIVRLSSGFRHVGHSQRTTPGPLDTTAVRQLIQDVFPRGVKADAEELLSFILRKLHSELVEAAGVSEIDDSAITSIFSCLLSCNGELERFYILPVPIQASNTVEAALESFLNGYVVSRWPLILMLQLKYFSFRAGKAIKTNKRLIISNRLDLEQSYRLFAVIFHHGESTNNGHYSAAVFHGNRWIDANDTIISSVTESQVLTYQWPRVPYILFYCQL